MGIPGRRSLPSTERGFLIVPFAHTTTKQNHAFSVVCPSLWNGLPLALRLFPRIATNSFYAHLKVSFWPYWNRVHSWVVTLKGCCSHIMNNEWIAALVLAYRTLLLLPLPLPLLLNFLCLYLFFLTWTDLWLFASCTMTTSLNISLDFILPYTQNYITLYTELYNTCLCVLGCHDNLHLLCVTLHV